MGQCGSGTQACAVKGLDLAMYVAMGLSWKQHAGTCPSSVFTTTEGKALVEAGLLHVMMYTFQPHGKLAQSKHVRHLLISFWEARPEQAST